MNPKATLPVRVSRHYAAPAERVFDAWLDPANAGRWLFATPTGAMQRVEIDARVGGRFCIVERRDGVDAEHYGEYLEIDRPRRLVFRFSVQKYNTDGDRVAIEIRPQGSGCELTLSHDMKPQWAEYAARTESGWRGILDGLAAALA